MAMAGTWAKSVRRRSASAMKCTNTSEPAPNALTSKRGSFIMKTDGKRNILRRKSQESAAGASPMRNSTLAPSDSGVVLVAGATGGVGQLVTAKLLQRGYRVRALTRDKEKASILFSTDTDKLELVVADGRVSEQIKIAFSPTSAGRVRAVIDCTGTTAFPSARWKDNNDPSTTSTVVKNIVDAANGIDASDSDNNDKDFIRYVFLSSIGVDRMSSFPFLILNFFGALEHKKIAEDYIKQSGLPYTIFRPARLTDGPYTSYDLNTLLKATSGNRKDVMLSNKDDMTQEQTSRITLADACVACLSIGADTTSTPGNGSDALLNRTISIANVEGAGSDDSIGPGLDPDKWRVKLLDAK